MRRLLTTLVVALTGLMVCACTPSDGPADETNAESLQVSEEGGTPVEARAPAPEPQAPAQAPAAAKEAPENPTANAPSGPAPDIHVAEPTFDWGVVTPGQKVTHVFEIENVGETVLTLDRADAG